MRRHILIVAPVLFFLSACTGAVSLDDYSHYLRNKGIAQPTGEVFPHCLGYGCDTVRSVLVKDVSWKAIESSFSPPPSNAEEERAVIAKAIGVFETRVGALTGTEADQGGTFLLYAGNNANVPFQQDCIDESTNTTIYLALLQQRGLMRYHRTLQPETRLPFVTGRRWWHQTAVIEDISNTRRYAVDSWFRDNGVPPFIVPLEDWKAGWAPEKI